MQNETNINEQMDIDEPIDNKKNKRKFSDMENPKLLDLTPVCLQKTD